MREMMLAIVVLLLTGAVASFFLAMPEVPAQMAATAPATPAATNDTQREALFAAVAADDMDRTAELLVQSPDLAGTRAAIHAETPLHRARSVSMAQLLVEAGADLLARDRIYQATPARWARSEGRADVADYLDGLRASDRDLPYLVVAGDHAAVAGLLHERPEALDERTSERDVLGAGLHPLHLAAAMGQTKAAKVLLDAGANVNVNGGEASAQPLQSAARAGHVETVKLLVSAGARLDARDAEANHTALWYAAVAGREDVVRLLLDAGATVEPGLADAVRAAAQNASRDPSPAAYLRIAALLDGH